MVFVFQNINTSYHGYNKPEDTGKIMQQGCAEYFSLCIAERNEKTINDFCQTNDIEICE